MRPVLTKWAKEIERTSTSPLFTTVWTVYWKVQIVLSINTEISRTSDACSAENLHIYRTVSAYISKKGQIARHLHLSCLLSSASVSRVVWLCCNNAMKAHIRSLHCTVLDMIGHWNLSVWDSQVFGLSQGLELEIYLVASGQKSCYWIN